MRQIVLVTLLASVLAVVSCLPRPRAQGEDEQSVYQDEIPSYNYNYAVNDPLSGDTKSHSEHRYGDRVTGSYSQLMPDGKYRTVNYYADDATGYNVQIADQQLI